MTQLALLLATLDPTAPDRLRAAHFPDRLGYCAACSMPESGPTRWPCTLYALAVASAEVVRFRGRSRRG